MSFRLFLYYCSLGGGCAAYLGWALGKTAASRDAAVQAGLKGMILGMLIGLALALADALGHSSVRNPLRVGSRVVVAGACAAVAGFVGGFFGQALYGWRPYTLFLLLGWTVTGLLIGASLGLYELLSRMARDEDTRGAQRKIQHGMLGGSLGGGLGGFLFLLLQRFWSWVLGTESLDDFWSPGASGFVVLGLSVGLMIGLAQVILKVTWVYVEKGFRPGRELIISKEETIIGRAESCDIGLFGDPGVERVHARILLRDNYYFLHDAATPGGTFLNGARIDGPTALRSGDLIELGRSALRFRERQRQARI